MGTDYLGEFVIPVSDPRLNRLRISGVLCALALVCILIAGLWPFGHPRNDVVWLADQHAVRYGKRATILSIGQLPRLANDACSIEIWLKPSRSTAGGTVLEFYSSSGAEGLSLHHSLTDLRLDGGATRGSHARIYANKVFRTAQLVFLTIVSGSGETSVYLNGALVRRVPVQTFRPPPDACSGNFVVGDSAEDNNSWEGEFHGLAIYQYGLTPRQANMDYQSWVTAGRPAQSVVGTPDALYLFNENGGDIVRDLGKSGVNLRIPERYTIARQVLLESPWRAFEPTWGYVQDILINIGGFIPFGFALAAFLAARSRVGRVTGIVVLAGFLVSLTIESLQACLPTRDSDLTDVWTNTLGTFLGAMFFQSWLPEPLRIFSWMSAGDLRSRPGKVDAREEK